MMATVNPFDPTTILFAKHAQHVVLVHFPIGLFTVGVAFDLAAAWRKRRGAPGDRTGNLVAAAYYNLLVAAVFTVPVVVTGILAWQFALEGQRLKGILLAHLLSACASSVLIWISWWVQFRGRRQGQTLPSYRLWIEIAGVVLIALTGHLGGFLSGVNGGV
jgi:uncharacterized membrane protein